MKVTCLFVFTILLLASCGDNSRSPATESQIGHALEAGGTFNDAEKNIAIRICYALRSKNTNYRANFLDTDFKFLLTQRDCLGKSDIVNLTTQLKEPDSGGEMQFLGTSSIDYYKKVLTDQHGVLSSLCGTLLQGGDPQRTILSGNELIELSFYTSEQDHLIKRSASRIGQNYVISKEERYRIITDTRGAGLKIGKVSLISKDETCENGVVSSFSQQSVD